MSVKTPNPEQQAAIEAPGLVFVSAGAGTGKTLVLVERFVRAVCEQGLSVDSVLVITYTDRAAGELRSRIRNRLVELGRTDLARELDGAWISTIHGYCHRLLKAHPFAAGLDPRFRVLDESQARVIRGEAFEEALTGFCAGAEPERLRLLGTYGAGDLRRMISGVYETLRSAGRALELVAGDAGDAPLDAQADHDRGLLQELLVSFERCYRAAKEQESALDFEDLQHSALELLSREDDVGSRERWRFRSVLVDEFQDTNRLQCELIDRLQPEELFFVGDEFQSIYRFRHADLGVFRERRAQAEGVLPLTLNYRSRPEVLAVVNELFSSDFGEEYQPLEAAGRLPDPAFGPAVELLVTDKSSYKDTGVHWRRGEAKRVAARVKELVDSEEVTPGEIVLLFAAGTDAEQYEEELRALGLPTFRATGRGYYGQQQVVDLLAYLRLLHNRYDDEALVTVLASPLVGVSNDALVLLRFAAPRRPLFTAVERSLPAELAERDARLLKAFRQRYDRLAVLSTTVGLERLCEQIVAEHDYDLAVLTRWDGRRRYANLRKLARLARSYEELRGPDIEGFVRFVREQDAAGTSEREAVAEEEDADAIRLLTIHTAKGLEFKVVVVTDAGRAPFEPDSDEILVLPDGRFGFKVADPETGARKAALGYDAVRAVDRAADDSERLRLYYVAMTRAIDRLIVAGSIDPERRADIRTPIAWVLGRLGVEELPADGPVELERGDARLLLHVDRYRPGAEEPPPAAAEEPDQLALFSVEQVSAPELPPLEPIPAPPLHRVRRLSYSALALYERCSYRFYAERVAGMRPVDERVAVPGQAGLAATEIGDAVHRLLEQVDLANPAPPELEPVRAWYPAATDEELARIRAHVDAYCGSALAARVAALPGAAAERPFAFEHDGVLLHGRLDVLHLADGSALVVDFKTNVLEERAPGEVVEADYALQRLVYALACFRAGAKEVEVVYQLLERPDEPVTTTFKSDDVPTLESQLSAAIAEIQAGRFVPTPSEFICAGCPALDVVCSGPQLRR